MREGKVYLAGGGCGGAELLTMKAWKVLQKCDTVVYDSLVSEELLRWTRPECEKIYVGKRYGCHSMTQPEINTLLVEKAREGKTVVRLKGGDPYVFGRGGEEFMAVRGAGVCCEEIPGITSAVAVPAAAGIPVTHRGLSDSVTIVTGTAAKAGGQEELKLDFQTLAQLKGTLVILMGMHHLEEIVVGLLGAGMDRNTPCAVIMEGTTSRQKAVRSPLFELPRRAACQGIVSPAVIVIGAVAELALTACGGAAMETEKKEWEAAQGAEGRRGKPEAGNRRADNIRNDEAGTTPYEAGALAGISVGVTGTAHFADRLSRALREKGAEPWDMSFMEIVPAGEELPEFAGYGWLVFTSPNGVRVFLEKMKRKRRDLRTLSGQKIAVIGPGTAEALQEAGIYADYMPEVYDAGHLARGLADIVCRTKEKTGPGGEKSGHETEKERAGREKMGAWDSVIFLRARQGSDVLPRVFRERGISFTEYALYELGVQEKKRGEVIAKEPDYIVFGSAMGARAYFEGLRARGLQNGKSRCVCIGKWCAEEVKKYVAGPVLTAEEAGVDAIVTCLCRERIRSEKQSARPL